jgi:uncharacterized membrane protein YqgA involved in biofilm formation
MDKILFAAIGTLSLVCLEGLAMILRIDGTYFGIIMAAIGTLIGSVVGITMTIAKLKTKEDDQEIK